MKKLLNDPKMAVPEMLDGYVRANPDLAIIQDSKVVLRADHAALSAAGQVAIISGGGAGHEPAHVGYVGRGMLTAAVSGDVFTSPGTDAVLDAIRSVGGRGGVLLIVKNYTGDRLNFGLAAEIARQEGIRVEMVIVDDDIALAEHSQVGRRGVAGTVLVHKIAGAAADKGASLDDVVAVARRANEALSTMGVALTSCTVPGASEAAFALAQDEIEFGLGIHGEAGLYRDKMRPAKAIVAELVAKLSHAAGVKQGDRVAVLVNNLGGTPGIELGVVVNETLQVFEALGLQIERCYSGTLLTALEMAGCSISLLVLDDELLALLDSDTSATAWPRAPKRAGGGQQVIANDPSAPSSHTAGIPADPLLERGVMAIVRTLKGNEPHITALDAKSGDGDLGLSLARGAEAIEMGWKQIDHSSPATTISALSTLLRRSMGGTSGALYAIALQRAANVLGATDQLSPRAWADAFEEATRALSEFGGAKRGDKTMLDAMIPAAEAFASNVRAGTAWREALSNASEVACKGASNTAGMVPRQGRASYLNARVAEETDAGAEAFAIWMKALSDAI